MTLNLLTINDDKELQFIIEKVIVDSTIPSKEIWLSLAPLDTENSRWGWTTGIYRNQTLYSSFPARCYQYCADWRVSTNQSTPHIWFNATTLQQARQWQHTTPSDQKLVIIEYESTIAPTIARANPNSTFITIGNLKVADKWAVRVNDVNCKSLVPTVVNQTTSLQCGLETLKTYEGIFNISIADGTLNSYFVYRFNSPWIVAIKGNSNDLSATIYGANFQQSLISPTPATILVNSIPCSIINYNFTSTPQTILLNSVKSQLFTSIQITYNSNTAIPTRYYINQYEYPIFEQTTGLFYRYFGNPTTFEQSLLFASQDQLLYSQGHLANINTTELYQFVHNQFANGNRSYKVWADLLYINSQLLYNNQSYTTQLTNATGLLTGRFYFNGATQGCIGIESTTTDTYPLVIVYGLQNPVVDSSIPRIIVPTLAGGTPYSVHMKSNFLWFNYFITYTFNGKTYNTATSNIKAKTIDIIAPPGSGVNQPLDISIVNSDKKSLSYTIHTFLDYPAPIISGIKCPNDYITIMGSNFAEPIQINNLNCNYIKLFSSGELYCQLKESPNGVNFSITANGQQSNSYTQSNQYAWIQTVSPQYIPFDGSILTIVGDNLGSQASLPIVTLERDTTIISTCSNVTFLVDQKSFTCIADPSDIEGQYSVKYQQINAIQRVEAVVIYTNATINTTWLQNQFIVTFSGSFLDLYKKDWKLKIGSGVPGNINCTNWECTFDMVEGCTSGLVSIFSRTGRSLFQTIMVWTPLIFNITPAVINPLSEDPIIVNGLFFHKGVQVRFFNYSLPNVTISESQIVIHSVPMSTGNISVSIVDLSNPDVPIPSNRINVVYPKPVVTKVTTTAPDIQYRQNITIVGQFLGVADRSLYPGLNTPVLTYNGLSSGEFTTTYTSFDKIVAWIPYDSRSGEFNITIDGQTSFSYPVKVCNNFTLDPFIQSIENRPATTGSMITIIGYYLAPYSWTGQQSLFVSIENLNCTSLNLAYSSTAPYYLACNAPPGSGKKTLYINNGQDTVTFDIVYQSPTIESTTSTHFGRPGTVSIFGSNFAPNNVAVTIGGIPCTYPRVNSNYDMLECRFASNVPISQLLPYNNQIQLDGVTTGTFSLESNITLQVYVEIDGYNTTAPTFIYSVQPDVCEYQCVYGQCEDGHCVCTDGYTGLDCSLEVVVEAHLPSPALNSVDLILGLAEFAVGFNISIIGLREVSPTMTTINQVEFSSISNWTVNSITNVYVENNYNNNNNNNSGSSDDQETINFPKPNVKLFQYKTSLEIVDITVNLTVFLQDGDYNFAGDIFTVGKNSVKYQIEINNWKFVDPLNTLQLLVLTKSTAKEETCIATANSYKNQKGSLREVEIVDYNGILHAYYSDRILVDDRLEYSQVIVLEDGTTPTNEDLHYNRSAGLLTAICIPHFENSAIIDPNYQVLIVIPDQNCLEQIRRWRKPLIITLVILGLISILITILIVLYQRYKYHMKILYIRLIEYHMECYQPMIELLDFSDD
ncbi:hypothetical protein PPL_08238 [Heterostelium album PN500]|uniref:IPT/TIG domain-containing protein n=1 Tax=Heterostelium pallidum (strain ATCC 26659 / Pp 5 / PN500) TaxID=670386 RepID=D3BJ03_HETP5|nr:hypothetical protein PPL_08238 [Heterostelium album PN500]EFA78777.1 hypothetical protein PPL_08238 [Heterostelium album PN500]|eukprot:XP_020430901.1 hypothetical protein PPL_08238 [Heterostelium album PN500]